MRKPKQILELSYEHRQICAPVPHTFYVLAALIVFLGIMALRAMPTDMIRQTPAQRLTRIAVKLALRRFIIEHSGAEIDQSEAAYRDVCRLIGRDFAAEAEAVIE